MIVKYYFGSYYVIHPAYSYVFKITQMLDGATSIQMVVSLPVYGEDIDPNDIIVIGVMDNLKAFVAKLTS
jgi:hypothetical protein